MTEEMTVLGAHYLTDVRNRFAGLKGLADAALEQAEADFFTVTGPEDNSLAVLVKHLSGNMVSRWGNLGRDGESAARDRDAEFVVHESRAELLAGWETGWQALFTALDGATVDRLTDTVTIRGEAHTLPGVRPNPIGCGGQLVAAFVEESASKRLDFASGKSVN